MRIKSYFAKSVDEAMVQARAELGTDALLLNTRKAAGEAGKPESYEVVFGTVEAVTPAVPTPVRALHAPTGAKDPQKDSAPSSERQVGDLPHHSVKSFQMQWRRSQPAKGGFGILCKSEWALTAKRSR